MSFDCREIEPRIISGAPLDRILDNASLGELMLPMLQTHGEAILQVDAFTGEELTAIHLLKRAIRIAKWLKSQGVTINDSISVNSENRIEFCAPPVAAFLMGAIFAPLNPDYTPGELKHVLNLSKPKIIFCSAGTLDKTLNVMPDHPYIQQIVLFDDNDNDKCNRRGVISYKSIIDGADLEDFDETFEVPNLDPIQAVATILCSSGTTGLPKGVMCTHDNMSSYVDVMRATMAHAIENEDPSDSILGLSPFFHSMGFMLMFLNLLRGKKMVVIRKFQIKNFLDAVVKYRLSRLIVPPAVMVVLLKHPMTKKYDLSFVKEIRTGAAPMGKDMEMELSKKFNVTHVSQTYGMTETTLGTLMSPYGETKIGSVGKIVPGMLVKVVDTDNKPLGPFQEGELCFKGPLIMKGYINDPVATDNTIDKDGWLRTGDVAYYDKEYYFYIVDRIKELIKYKGYQVAPAELEALLHTHSAVQDAAVVGLPDEDSGELPLAFVLKKPGHKVSETEIEKYVEDNVSPQKRLRGGIYFVDLIPRNPTGKILRRLLREKAIQLKKSKL